MQGTDGTSNYARDTGVTATADSSWSATYDPSKVIDGVSTTFYSSAAGRSCTLAWLEVDLGKGIPMSSIARVSYGNSIGGNTNREGQQCFMLLWLDASGNQLQANWNKAQGFAYTYYYYPGEPSKGDAASPFGNGSRMSF